MFQKRVGAFCRFGSWGSRSGSKKGRGLDEAEKGARQWRECNLLHPDSRDVGGAVRDSAQLTVGSHNTACTSTTELIVKSCVKGATQPYHTYNMKGIEWLRFNSPSPTEHLFYGHERSNVFLLQGDNVGIQSCARSAGSQTCATQDQEVCATP